MDKKKLLLGSGMLLALALVLLVIVSSVPALRQIGSEQEGVPIGLNKLVPKESEGFAKFGSEAEFRKYLSEASESRSLGFGAGVSTMGAPEAMSFDWASSAKMTTGLSDGVGRGGATGRVSTTNVQVAGIDEPDIVKTDGSVIYFSREPDYRTFDIGPSREMMEKRMESNMIDPQEVPGFPNPLPSGNTSIVAAFPADALAKIGSLGRSGELLLFGETLVLFDSSRRDIAGYDISDKANPKESWVMRQGMESELIAARSHDGTLYLVERTATNESSPCPIAPFMSGAEKLSIACTDVYRPASLSPVDSVFTVLSVDPETGVVGEHTSFVGASGQSSVYMNGDALYATYPKMSDPIRYLLGFFRENQELLPGGMLDRLEKLSRYDIGYDAKMTEFSQIMEKAFLGRGGDEQLRSGNEIRNRMTEYEKAHLRDLESTGIVKISIPKLSVKATGSVPGHLLSQFSLDEYEGNLRVATTVGGRSAFWFGWGGGRNTSANDVYVLDGSLDRKGSLLDLGLGERIYATRFIGDKGYLVTFRETDPFYVLDLSDPKLPRKAGELKIPGYSSYLHPLSENLILGVGMEDGRVKLSLFDVASPDDPREVSKYSLDEYWSEAVGNHHAFLADPEHEIFFLPGSQGGYVFSYEGGELSLAKAAKDDRVKRALFIGDAFYIVSEDAVYSYDENTWEKKATLAL